MEHTFKLKYGNGIIFASLIHQQKKIISKFLKFYSVPRLKQKKLQNAEHIPFRLLVVKLIHGIRQLNLLSIIKLLVILCRK